MPSQPLLSELNPELAPGDRIDIELLVPEQAEPITLSDTYASDPPF